MPLKSLLLKFFSFTVSTKIKTIQLAVFKYLLLNFHLYLLFFRVCTEPIHKTRKGKNAPTPVCRHPHSEHPHPPHHDETGWPEICLIRTVVTGRSRSRVELTCWALRFCRLPRVSSQAGKLRVKPFMFHTAAAMMPPRSWVGTR